MNRYNQQRPSMNCMKGHLGRILEKKAVTIFQFLNTNDGIKIKVLKPKHMKL